MTVRSRLLGTRPFRWGVNTLASFIVNLGVTIGLHEFLGVNPTVSYAAALVMVFSMNFVLFRYYVFVQREPLPMWSQFVTYATSAAGFRLAEYGGFLILHGVVGLQYVVAIVLVQGTSFVAKYFVYGDLVFRSRGGVAPQADETPGGIGHTAPNCARDTVET